MFSCWVLGIVVVVEEGERRKEKALGDVFYGCVVVLDVMSWWGRCDVLDFTMVSRLL